MLGHASAARANLPANQNRVQAVAVAVKADHSRSLGSVRSSTFLASALFLPSFFCSCDSLELARQRNFKRRERELLASEVAEVDEDVVDERKHVDRE